MARIDNKEMQAHAVAQIALEQNRCLLLHESLQTAASIPHEFADALLPFLEALTIEQIHPLVAVLCRNAHAVVGTAHLLARRYPDEADSIGAALAGAARRQVSP